MSKDDEPKFDDSEHAEIWRAICRLERKFARLDERTKIILALLIATFVAILGLYLRGM